MTHSNKKIKITIEVSLSEIQALKKMLDCADTEIQQLFGCKNKEAEEEANKLLPIWRKANRLTKRIEKFFLF